MLTFLNILLAIFFLFICIGLIILLLSLFYSFAFLKNVKMIFLKFAMLFQEKLDSTKTSVKWGNTWLEHSEKYLIIKERFDIENRLEKWSEHVDKVIKKSNKLIDFGAKAIIATIIFFLLTITIMVSLIIYIITKLF